MTPNPPGTPTVLGTLDPPTLDPAAWDAWATRLPTTPAPLAADDRVLVLGAHPDDETIGAGALLAQHRGACDAVVLTAGEGCVVDDRVDADDLAAQRLAEWRVATCHLGIEPLDGPRWPDGALAEHEEAVTEHLAGILAAGGHDVVLAVWAGDPHPDHQALGRAARRASRSAGVRLVEYAVWAPYWCRPEELERARLGVVETGPDAAHQRRQALAAYLSQTAALLPGAAPIVPQELLRRHERSLVVGDVER